MLCCKIVSLPFLWIGPPHPPPWHNPRKGRDQILPSGNLEYAKFFQIQNSLSDTLTPYAFAATLLCRLWSDSTAADAKCAYSWIRGGKVWNAVYSSHLRSMLPESSSRPLPAHTARSCNSALNWLNVVDLCRSLQIPTFPISKQHMRPQCPYQWFLDF